MEDFKHTLDLVGRAIKQSILDAAHVFQYGSHSSLPVIVYFLVLHVLLISLALYILLWKKSEWRNSQLRRTRTFKRQNKAVTIESCEWLNSVLAWLYLHSRTKTTPDLAKLWLRRLNWELQKDRKKGQRTLITGLHPGCLPPKLTNVYCLCVDGSMQCLTFHMESTELGFHVSVNQPSVNGKMKPVFLEVKVTRLVGEVALQLNNSPTRFEVMCKFIGNPDIELSTRILSKEEIDSATIEAVEEKLKEVICKTVTNIPLAEAGKTASEGSLGKDKLAAPILKSCLGEDGKLLIKVIKALGLSTKDKSGSISPYCILSTGNPPQRKRTSLMKDTHNPFWNEYFAFDINSKTREITIDIFDYEKTPQDINHHMDDNELTQEQDDFLGQVIVPLSTVNRDQTCRLVLPILPRTNKCDYVSGELSLEFDFDKDGKVIDKTLPYVRHDEVQHQSPVEEETVIPTQAEDRAEADPETDGPPETVRKYCSYSYSLDGSYMETSLDELAHEIEAYEAETRPRSVSDDTDKAAERLVEMEPVFELEAKEKAVEEVKEDKVDAEPAPAPIAAEEDKDEDEPKTEKPEEKKEKDEKEGKGESSQEKEKETPEPKMRSKKFRDKFRRRPKSTADIDTKLEEEEANKRHSYHPGDTIEEKDEEGDEGAVGITPEPKSKIRRSFNMRFRRSKKGEKENEHEGGEKKEEEGEKGAEEEKKEEADVEKVEVTPEPSKSRWFKRGKKEEKDKEKEGEEGKKEEDEKDKEEEKEKEKETDDKKDETKETAHQHHGFGARLSGRFGRRKKEEKEKENGQEEGKEEKEGAAAEASVEATPEPSKSKFRFKRKKEDKPKEGEEEEKMDDGGKKDDEVIAEPTKSRFSIFKRGKKDEKDKEAADKEGKEVEKEQEEKTEKEVKDEKEKESETKTDETKEKEPEKEEVKAEVAVEAEDTPVEKTEEKEEKKTEPKEKEETLAVVSEDAAPAQEEPAKEPKPKRRINLGFHRKQRPMSMSAFDKQKPGTSADDDKKSRDDRVRHSYHAGDLSDPAPLRESTSQSSLFSYSPNSNSTLVIECPEKGEKKYYLIPPPMAKRGTYEQKGVKYHVYNDHMFRADHLGETTECAVCGNQIMRKPGKQAYRCKDCKMTCHKKCHYQTTLMCPSSTVKSLDIKKAGDTEV